MKSFGTRLGILGGGQLARMIAEAAHRDGMQPVVLAESRDEPAVIEAAEWVQGALHDRKALWSLAGQTDLLTIENEFVDVDLLHEVLTAHPDLRIAPGLQAISIAQDKLCQKELFNRLGLPTADHECVDIERIQKELPLLRRRFPAGFVLKFARHGYDGRGNLVVLPSAHTSDDKIETFCRAAAAVGTTLYAEQLVDFSTELAIVASRASDGQLQCFPAVESRQERGICREVVGPAARLGKSPKIARQAADVIGRIATDLQFCGTLAVEFFLARDGRLLVNEMAPRVHNSGHFSLYRDEISQFDLHIQAITGRALPLPETDDFVVMRNLLGPPDIAPGVPCPAPGQRLPYGVELYWYDKRTVSAGRKMGHLTGRANSVCDMYTMLDAMRRYEARFWNELTRMKVAG